MSLRRSSRAAATKPAIVDASGSDSGDDYEEEDAGYEEEEQDVEEELLTAVPEYVEGYDPVLTQFNLGPALTGAQPHFHGDAWNALVYGRKQWFVSPPSRAFFAQPGQRVDPFGSALAGQQRGEDLWMADSSCHECMECRAAFTFFKRKHHCRRCGICVCKVCAPEKNTRPIIEWGMHTPVRHCKKCYM